MKITYYTKRLLKCDKPYITLIINKLYLIHLVIIKEQDPVLSFSLSAGISSRGQHLCAQVERGKTIRWRSRTGHMSLLHTVNKALPHR